MPNKKISEETSLKRFIVPVSFIEQFSGHLMFPRLLHHSDTEDVDQTLGKMEIVKQPKRQLVKHKRPEELCKHVKCEVRKQELDRAMQVIRRTQTAE